MTRAEHSNVLALQRLLTLLTVIPRGSANGMTTAELREALERVRDLREHKWETVSARTIERDLVGLSEAFEGLRRETAFRPCRWYWHEDAAAPAGVPMTAAQALAFIMVREHLGQVLPKGNMADLEPFFVAARKSLGDFPKHSRWVGKVRVEGLGFHAAPPKILAQVAAQVTDALLRERRCHVRYRALGKAEEKEYDVHPLGLLARNGIISLVCIKVEKERDERGPIQLHLHRMVSATCLEDMRQLPRRGFDLADFDVGGGVGVPALEELKSLRIRLLVDADAPFWPEERPLPDQKIDRRDDGRMEVQADVPNSLEFVAWLRGYGPKIEVLEPRELRQQLADEARRMAERHA